MTDSNLPTPEEQEMTERTKEVKRVRKAFEEAKKVDPDIWNWQATI